MRLYVIGPVSGVRGGNRETFEEAAHRLEDFGYDVLIPHWFIPEGTPWRIAMKRSVEMLVKCDGVAALDGWGSSKGARAEYELAQAIGMPAHPVETWIRGGL